MRLERSSLLPLLVLAAVPFLVRAQGLPAPSAESRTVEVELQSTDGGTSVSAEDATRLGLTTDGGEATLVPPTLVADAPAAWPVGLEGTPGEVTLELLVDEQGAVAEVKVVDAPHEPRLTEAALQAAPGLRFTPATLAGVPVAVRLPFVYRFVPPAAPVPVSTARLTGEVRARGTRRPLADALLFVDGSTEPAGTVDAQGRFTLELRPGTHRVEARAPGHTPSTFEETLSEGQSLQVIYRLQPGRVNPYETVVRDDRPRTEVTRITLHEQELREVPGTLGDPFRVVMLMPGVGSLASGISYPVVRGSQPAATGFFLDGVRIPMLYHLMLGPAVIHPDFIDTVDFFPGSPPVQYGRLLGGAVEGRLSRPREDRLHVTAYADLLNSGGFIEYPFESTGTSVSVAGRVSYSALLISLGSKLLSGSDAEKVHANFWDYQARIEQKVGEGRVRLFALGSSDDVGSSPSTYYIGSTGGSIVSRFHRVDLRGTHPLAGGDAEVGLTVGSDALGLDGEESERLPSGAISFRKVGEYALRQTTFAMRAGWKRRLDSTLELAVGGDVEHRRAATDITGTGIPPGTNPDDPVDPIKSPSSLATFSGVYAAVTWVPAEKWVLQPGVRVDNYHLSPGINHAVVEPRLTVRHQLTDALVLKGGAGVFHQSPTVLVHLPAVDTSSLRYGLQEGLQFDVGAEWKAMDGLELSGDAFYNPLTRAVELDLQQVVENRRRRGLATPDPSTSGYAYGFELMARHPLGRDWFGWVSYSFLQSKRRVLIDRYGDDDHVVSTQKGTLPFAFEQAHVINAALSYKFGNNWTVGTVVHFNTGRPESGEITTLTQRIVTTPEGEAHWVRQDRDKSERLDAFFRVDLRVAKSWAMEDFTLDAYLDVLNVSARQEVIAYDYGFDRQGTPQRKPQSLPIILPLLGVKGTY
ncbi:TonB-dependent receptor [Myxococcus sp. CA056]|uniref:TonB-dependent receptor domain-containing protein n=1 Tax=unclassified Myxococcus TaxID=2648731 RepID=UPI00157A7F36|nr:MULTISPECIES: TonB-dependent receptor [unclassified Myxococcus]NTX10931.1 TonB-dependent receptor [Myxococcus sp. CA056]NTX37183.1 TonB-dependent receptor [Myxococcus sp. CA033]